MCILAAFVGSDKSNPCVFNQEQLRGGTVGNRE